MTHLIFDVDDTLYNQLAPFINAYDALFRGQHCVLPEELYITFRKYSDGVFNLVESGEMSLLDMHAYRITEAFKEYGIEISREDAMAFQKKYAINQTKIELLDGMRAVLDFGKQNNLVMGIITNGPTEHQKNKIEQLGMTRWIKPEHIFISEEMGIAKPDIRLFQQVQKNMNLDPDQTYYIGDSFHNDINGAKKAGWHAIWFNTRNHKIPELSLIKPDYTVTEDRNMLHLIQKL